MNERKGQVQFTRQVLPKDGDLQMWTDAVILGTNGKNNPKCHGLDSELSI